MPAKERLLRLSEHAFQSSSDSRRFPPKPHSYEALEGNTGAATGRYFLEIDRHPNPVMVVIRPIAVMVMVINVVVAVVPRIRAGKRSKHGKNEEHR